MHEDDGKIEDHLGEIGRLVKGALVEAPSPRKQSVTRESWDA